MLKDIARPEFGYFGKVPSRGDFVSHGLSKNFIDAIDSWLQEAIVRSQAELGTSWLNKYLASPIWRFALGRGVCSNVSHIGILMPSVDSVGRYFPFVIAHAIENDFVLMELIENNAQWFEKAEKLGLDALEKLLEPKAVNEMIETLALSECESRPSVIDEMPAGWYRYQFSNTASLGSVVQHAYANRLDNAGCRISLWWSTKSDSNNAILLCGETLPDPAIYTTMLAWE